MCAASLACRVADLLAGCGEGCGGTTQENWSKKRAHVSGIPVQQQRQLGGLHRGDGRAIHGALRGAAVNPQGIARTLRGRETRERAARHPLRGENIRESLAERAIGASGAKPRTAELGDNNNILYFPTDNGKKKRSETARPVPNPPDTVAENHPE